MGVLAAEGAVKSTAHLEGYKPVRVLETGGLGYVELFEAPGEEPDVAVKFIKRSAVNATREEAIVKHSLLKHPHVVTLKEVVLCREHVGVVMEYCAAGTLEHFIHKTKGGRLSETRARQFFQQLMMAVDYTERKGITNRDLKLSNTLLSVRDDGELQLKISDFGYSIHSVADANQTAEMLYYMAPEIMEDGPVDDKLADIFQCGVILHFMLYGKYPFQVESSGLNRACSEEIQELHAAELAGGLKLPDDVPVSQAAKDLLQHMLVGPNERLRLADVMAHEWFVQDLPEEEAHINDGIVEEPALSMKKRQSVLDIKQLLDFALA